jgi:transketolase
MSTDITRLKQIADRLRAHSLRSTSIAGSGHPTTCMSAADVLAALFFEVMHFDPKAGRDPMNDRFVLSKGHAAPILYALWAEAGAFPVADLDRLREIDCDLEGHPTPRLDFVDVATGSLGQGLSAAAGIALNAKYLDKIPTRTYVLMGDGECAEGAVWEAAAFASQYALDNLCAIVDVNRLGQSQATMYGHDMEVYRRRFEAFGWNALVIDGHDMQAVVDALAAAEACTGKPTAILAKTFKGAGVDFLQDKDGWHGKPVPKEDLDKALAQLDLVESVDTSVKPKREGAPAIPREAAERLGPPAYTKGEKVATRAAYGKALARLGAVDPRVVGLDGDTKNSTYSQDFMKAFPERFFECFIAEQNLVGVAVGLGSQGKVPFASSFAAFFTRAYDQIRMSAVSFANVKIAGSHAGISIGEDGPSQMALEDLAAFRAIPRATVLYPSDAVSTEWAVKLAAENHGVFFIRTSRPATPVIYDNAEPFAIGQAKVVRQSDNDKVTLIGAGVTLFEALKAADALAAEGIAARVIDVFSVKPLDEATIKAAAAATGGRVVTVEDHYHEGGIGEAVAAALSGTGATVKRLAVNDVPRSGPSAALMAMFGIDADAVVSAAKSLL